MRSGHHGVMQWIEGHFHDNICVLNDCVPKCNPFFIDTGVKNDQTKKSWDLYTERSGALKCKSCLLYNYEDRNLEDVFNPEFESIKPAFIGDSKELHNVIIVRDPYNQFASRLKWLFKLHSPEIPHLIHPVAKKMLVERWKQYAREYLGWTNIVPNKVVISYNQWFIDEDYRRSISKQLNLEFNDRFKNKLSMQGKSSFDEFKYENKANEMKVLERWKAFQNNYIFTELIADEELRVLSDKIFGPIV